MSSRADLEFFAVTAPGLEEVCAAELAGLDLGPLQVVTGGVEFSGNLRELYRANLRLRTASRVLVRVGRFGCRDFPSLYRRALRLPWGKFLRPAVPCRIRATSRASRLVHTARIEETVGAALTRALGPPSPDPVASAPEQQVLVRMEEDQATISIDSSGELLHRRGYRTEQGAAPLRETLAAGLLQLLNWDPGTPLLDPLCGSGTLPIEGLLLALDLAPGRQREFAFMHWPRYRPGLWQALLQETEGQVRRAAPLVEGWDRESEMTALAVRNAERAGVGNLLRLRCRELAAGPPEFGPGLAVCNPPYGLRLTETDLGRWYAGFGEACRRHLAGWRVAFLCPAAELAARTGLEAVPVARLRNGGLPVTLYLAQP